MGEYDAVLCIGSGGDIGNGLRLSGKIYEDRIEGGFHPFRDGEVVTTSPVVSVRDDVFTTRSGSRYKIKFTGKND